MNNTLLQRPKTFDYNIAVIGAGAGGLVSAYLATALKAKVALIEKQQMGGDCLNTGCVPSKTLIHIAKRCYQIKRAGQLGIRAEYQVDGKAVMQRVRQAIGQIAPHDSAHRYRALGVDVFQSEARLTSPWQIQWDNQQMTAKNIIIATGASPRIPPVKGLDQVPFLCSDTLWQLDEIPSELLLVGGGPIGCELAQAFARLGSKVSIVQRNANLLPREDQEVSSLIQRQFEQEGITVYTGSQLLEVGKHKDKRIWVRLQQNGQKITLSTSHLFLALGRRPSISGFGLEEIGIQINTRGAVATNGFLQTNYPHIYAVGDVASPWQFTHSAAHQAWHASINALFGHFKKFRINYHLLPWATFCDPQIARIGLNETQARQQNITYEVTRYDLRELDRAICEGENHGFIKVLTKPGSDRILGVTIVATHAAEMISEFACAMCAGKGLNHILSTIHLYPAYSEANKYLAGQWKKAHAPAWLFPWLEKYHRWMRS